MKIAEILLSGNRGHNKWERAEAHEPIRCADGFALSVIAGGGTYCSPRPAMCTCGIGLGLGLGIQKADKWPGLGMYDVDCDYPGPYSGAEVGFPSAKPRPWSQWRRYCEEPTNPTGTIYSYVPAEMILALIERHGGEVS